MIWGKKLKIKKKKKGSVAWGAPRELHPAPNALPGPEGSTLRPKKACGEGEGFGELPAPRVFCFVFFIFLFLAELDPAVPVIAAAAAPRGWAR